MKVEGSNITINDSVYNKITIIPKGDCEQDSYSGKNKINVSSNLSVSNGFKEYTINVPAGSYILSCEDYITDGTYNSMIDFLGSTSSSTPTYLNVTNKSVNVTFSEDKVLMRIYSQDTYPHSLNITSTFTNLMLRLSSITDDTYEPYIGGIPSPNPDYPQDIRVVTDNLPNEYQEVEYIETTGTQYIDTNFLPTNNTIVKAKLYTTQNINRNWFGANADNLGNSFCFNAFDVNRVEYKIGNKNWDTKYANSNVVGTPFSIEFGKDKLVINNNTISTFSLTQFTSNLSLTIFVRNGGTGYISGRVYYFKIYENNVLVRDFIPCYRRSDNVIGLYDRVNNVFYTNQGTGTFTKGNDVNNSVVVQNKNLFDINWLTGSNITIENGVATGETRYFYTNFSQNAGGIPNTNFGNKQITLSFDYYTDGNQGTTDNDGIALSVIYTNGTETKIRLKNNVTTKTRYSLTSTNGKEISMICISYYNLGQNIVHFSDIQVELGSTATTYVAHVEQTYTLHLGTNYLAGIGDYKDEIVGKTDEWKIKRYVGKVVFDGSEDWQLRNTSANNTKTYSLSSFNDYLYKEYTTNPGGYALCDKFVVNRTVTGVMDMYTTGGSVSLLDVDGIAFYYNPNNLIGRSLYINTKETLPTYLTSNNAVLYYILATPTEETITDQTLITDLNNMYQALSYDGTTNITVTSEDTNAQMEVEVTYTSESDMCEKLLFIFNKMKDKLYHIIRSL